MKISVITPVYNGASTIRNCIESVVNQDYSDFEYIIVDGKSIDNTVDIIKEFRFKNLRWKSEKDSGLYDAFNKGILMATGDIVCFLCADDRYAHNHVLKNIADAFDNNPEIEMVYNDIVYINRKNETKVDRYWKSSPFIPGKFKKGWLPPNTALFIKRSNFLKHGLFNLRLKLASDVEMQYRFFEVHRLKSLYLPGISVEMKSGGASNSSIRNMYKSLKECHIAFSLNNVKFPSMYVFNSIFFRISQLFVPTKIKKYYRSKNHKAM